MSQANAKFCSDAGSKQMVNLKIRYDELMNPVLAALRALGGSGTNDEINNRVAEDLKIPAEQLEVLHSLVLLFDLGDTIMDEVTEVKDAGGTTLAAELIPGMADALRGFRVVGHQLALVADARPDTPSNVLRQHGLLDLFEMLVVSEVVGPAAGVASIDKPDPRIFRAALDALGIGESDYSEVVMVGNNLERDIVGANRLGLISVFFHWNERRRTRPLTAEETPCYTVTSAQELVELAASL
jgi:putative hydrolase of the HAD superfamily